ncbi:hypothetical protein LN042_12800 [Kitasatospora sp. RB6PN24]|uniref:hypothetical protein n=1 Tax=Kitasatospora humi TaxID=2893891 RepID=UPI001E357575|nr:hypothetical protein [Kitasatospora humi]MCC9307961.1 hypothetical protein [Kitasatospora humi]
MLIAWWILVFAAICGNLGFWLRRLGRARRRFMAEHPAEWARMGSREQGSPGPESGRILLWHAFTFLLLIAVGGVGAAGISGRL